MKRYKPIKEDFLDRAKVAGSETEVYVNPKSSKGEVRGILNKTGDLYTWSEKGIIHMEILPYLVNKRYIDLSSSVVQEVKNSGWLHHTLPHGVVSVQGDRNQRGTFNIGESNQSGWIYDYEKEIKKTFRLAKKKNPNLNFEFLKHTREWE